VYPAQNNENTRTLVGCAANSVTLRVSVPVRIKARLAGQGGSLAKRRNAESRRHRHSRRAAAQPTSAHSRQYCNLQGAPKSTDLILPQYCMQCTQRIVGAQRSEAKPDPCRQAIHVSGSSQNRTWTSTGYALADACDEQQLLAFILPYRKFTQSQEPGGVWSTSAISLAYANSSRLPTDRNRDPVPSNPTARQSGRVGGTPESQRKPLSQALRVLYARNGHWRSCANPSPCWRPAGKRGYRVQGGCTI